MGIPSYFSYIVKNHPQIIKQFNPNVQVQETECFNNLYLDCNSIIYDSFYKMDFTNNNISRENREDAIIQSVLSKIEEYIYTIRPSDKIYIAFDGVAPFAKMEQQRQRRYKSYYQSMISESILPKKTKDPWNTIAITPGTNFMRDLNEKTIHYFANQHEKYNVKKIIVSGSNESGEGEHKLFQYIRSSSEEHRGTKSIVYGLDADLIMLSMNHLSYTSIYLYRETPQFIQNISKDLEPNKSYLMDIPLLSETLAREMNMNSVGPGPGPGPDKDSDSVVKDYILLCFFLGNDFMPHFPSFNIRTGGLDKLLNAYSSSNARGMVKEGKIQWKKVRQLVEILASQEEKYFREEQKLRNRREKMVYQEDTPENKMRKWEAIPNYDRVIEKFIDPFKPFWEYRYYMSLFEIETEEEIREAKIRDICVKYLEGLEWCLKYYSTSCPDWRWSYRYHYPPLMKDLLRYIPYFEKELVPFQRENPVTEITQLCYVLPKQSIYLLPEKIMEKLSPRKDEWYRTDCEIVWAYCKYFWESHIILPKIDLNELEDLLYKNKNNNKK
jgi:5'-3' exonuclease